MGTAHIGEEMGIPSHPATQGTTVAQPVPPQLGRQWVHVQSANGDTRMGTPRLRGLKQIQAPHNAYVHEKHVQFYLKEKEMFSKDSHAKSQVTSAMFRAGV